MMSLLCVVVESWRQLLRQRLYIQVALRERNLDVIVVERVVDGLLDLAHEHDFLDHEGPHCHDEVDAVVAKAVEEHKNLVIFP